MGIISVLRMNDSCYKVRQCMQHRKITLQQPTLRSVMALMAVGSVLMACTRHSNNRPREAEPKPLVNVREASPNTNSRYNYFLITVRPSPRNTVLARYTLQAEVHTGQGQFSGSSAKVGNRFSYNVLLNTQAKLVDLLPSKGSASTFSEGKSIEFKCRYAPQTGAKKSAQHRLVLTVTEKDETGQNIHRIKEEVTLMVKRDIQALKSTSS